MVVVRKVYICEIRGCLIRNLKEKDDRDFSPCVRIGTQSMCSYIQVTSCGLAGT